MEIKNMFFSLGMYISKMLLSNLVNPDATLDNYGFKDHKLLILDFTNVVEIKLPEDLSNEKTWHLLTEAFFSTVNSLKSFTDISYFRAGYLTYGGPLAESVLLNAINQGFSSFTFLGISLNNISFDIPKVCSNSDFQNQVIEFRDLLSKDSKRKIYRHNHYNINYLKKIHNLICNERSPKLMYDFADFMLSAKNINSAFGLFLRCRSLENISPELSEKCVLKINTILVFNNIPHVNVRFIDRCEKKYGLFEFLWILQDLDVFHINMSHYLPLND